MMGSRGCKTAIEHDGLSYRTRRCMILRRQHIRAAKRSFNKRIRREARESLRQEYA